MSKKTYTRLAAGLLPVLIGAGLAGALPNTEATAGGPMNCEIRAVERGGGVSLEAIVQAAGGASGTYRLNVSGGGSDIAQSGDFSVGPGTKSSLGAVTLAGDGSYVARLSVTAGGTTKSCTKRGSL